MSEILPTTQVMCAYKLCQPYTFTRRETDDHFRDYCSEGCYDAAHIKLKNPHKKSDDEALNIAKIHAHINNKTLCGVKIKDAFHCAFPDMPVFEKTIVSGGTRGIHHDFKLQWLDAVEKTTEYKGCKDKSIIDSTKPPWINGVQFYNGTATKFIVGHLYARKFYETMLDDIIEHFKMVTAKPSYEEWLKDTCVQGKPKSTSPFHYELREKGYKSDYLSECRKRFNKTFVLTDTELLHLQGEVFQKANEVLEQKDYWLQIHGKMDEPDDFEVHWSGKVTIAPIVLTKQVHSDSGCDVNFEFTCVDGSVFKAKLRWGYGQCITNLRLDLK
jgi:hypothetical protein